MSSIGGDYRDFDPAEAAEIQARAQQREAANLSLHEALPALASAFARGSERLEESSMQVSIQAINLLTQPPAHSPLLSQLCALVLSELQAGLAPQRAKHLAELLTDEAARLYEGKPFSSPELVKEVHQFRERVQAAGRRSITPLNLVVRRRADA